MFSPKALGKAGDQTANQFLVHAIKEQRPDDGLLSEEEKDDAERLKQSRVWIMRGFVGVVAVCGASLTIMAPTDPLRLVLWALSITGASLFPVMVLSVWWKRLTVAGAIIGVVVGFAAAAVAIATKASRAASWRTPGPNRRRTCSS